MTKINAKPQALYTLLQYVKVIRQLTVFLYFFFLSISFQITLLFVCSSILFIVQNRYQCNPLVVVFMGKESKVHVKISLSMTLFHFAFSLIFRSLEIRGIFHHFTKVGSTCIINTNHCRWTLFLILHMMLYTSLSFPLNFRSIHACLLALNKNKSNEDETKSQSYTSSTKAKKNKEGIKTESGKRKRTRRKSVCVWNRQDMH